MYVIKKSVSKLSRAQEKNYTMSEKGFHSLARMPASDSSTQSVPDLMNQNL